MKPMPMLPEDQEKEYESSGTQTNKPDLTLDNVCSEIVLAIRKETKNSEV